MEACAARWRRDFLSPGEIMVPSEKPPNEQDRLRDPEFTSAPTPEGTSQRRFLGVPAWAAAVGFAALAALMYLLMLML
jgi:hypothetical protein